MELGEMFTAYGSDKQVRHWLADTYARELESFRGEEGALCEIGVKIWCVEGWAGGSLRAWAEWLPEFKIVGIDIQQPALDKLREYAPMVETICADQERPHEIFEALAAYASAYDVIIDDGSHLPRHQIGCWQALWPLVRSGGLYIIEDLEGTGQEDTTTFTQLSRMAHDSVKGVARDFKVPLANITFCGDACLIRKR